MSLKRKLIAVFMPLVGAYILFFIYVNSHPEILYSSEIKIGNEVILKIEIYKKIYKKLPNKLEDIGIKETMEGPIFYNKISEQTYSIYFGARLGESYIYYSEKGKWGFEG